MYVPKLYNPCVPEQFTVLNCCGTVFTVVVCTGRARPRACACRTGGESVLPAGDKERFGSVRHSLRSAHREWVAQTSGRVSARARLLRRARVSARREEARPLAGICVARVRAHTFHLPRTALPAVERPHGVPGGHAPQPRPAAGDGLCVGPGGSGGRADESSGSAAARIPQRGVQRRMVCSRSARRAPAQPTCVPNPRLNEQNCCGTVLMVLCVLFNIQNCSVTQFRIRQRLLHFFNSNA